MASVRTARRNVQQLTARLSRTPLVSVCISTIQAIIERRITTYAAAMSYYTLFSFVPLVIFLLAVLGIILRDPDGQETVTRTILSVLPTTVSEGVQQTIATGVSDIVDQINPTEHGLVGVAALVGLAWSASTMFTALRRGLNIAFGVPERRSAVAGKVWDLASVAGLLVLVPLGIIVTALLLFLLLLVAGAGLYLTRLVLSDELTQQIPSAAIARAVAQFGSYANSFVLVLLLYRFGPDRRLPMRLTVPASALAALGVEALKFGFSIYLRRFARFEALYGALSTAAGFLIFVYLVANIILFVAVLTSVVHDEKTKGDRNRQSLDQGVAGS